MTIEHSYGPLIGQKTERVVVGEADFSSGEHAETFFSNWVKELKSSQFSQNITKNGKPFNSSAAINYVGSMVVKGHKVKFYQ